MAVKIVIDPGHGGSDSGASGFGLLEKNLTLDIASRLKIRLTGYADVILTRSNDTFVGLVERATLANKAGADYFISIHVNAGGGTGFESFTYSSAAPRSVQLREVIHNEVAAFYKVHGFPDRGKKEANFAVLRESSMPAILLENLFIDTQSDADKLKDPAFREKIAGAIASGVIRAFNLQDSAPEPEPPSPQPPAHWAQADFQRLVDKGLVFGKHDLDSEITWGEFSAVLARLLDKLGV